MDNPVRAPEPLGSRRRNRVALIGALIGALLVWAPLAGLYVQREVAREISGRLVRSVPRWQRVSTAGAVGPRRAVAVQTTWAGWLDSVGLQRTMTRANLDWYVAVRRADPRGFVLETHAWPARCLITGNATTGIVRQACGWRWQTLDTTATPTAR
jgi:hypothetical protein